MLALNRMPVLYKLYKGDKKVLYVGKSDTDDIIIPEDIMKKICDDTEDYFTDILEITDKTGSELLWVWRKYYDLYKPEWNKKRPICTDEERLQNENRQRAYFYHKWKKVHG